MTGREDPNANQIVVRLARIRTLSTRHPGLLRRPRVESINRSAISAISAFKGVVPPFLLSSVVESFQR